MSYNNEQLEAFLIEAELINQKVKDLAQNKLSPEQFDRLQLLRAEDKKRRQQAQKRREDQAVQKRRLGRDGKGITKDFKHYCRFCQKQYEFQTPTCLKCQRKTMTLQQRQAQLQVMVADYKAKKTSRQERKHKWDMWQKTKASVWKKNSNNYSKWDYFVSDSQQQPQQEPIVPKNDPNFKALQLDIQERKRKREKDTNQTKRLKQKGNQLMKQGKYQEAMHKYTLALQHAKDVKSVYTNRALAFIKLKKFAKAIKDCTNVIQFMEVFQKVGQNKDLTFKAYSRRALAKKQMKNYQQALEDINQALKLIPNDNNAILLKKQIQGFLTHSKNVEELLRKQIKSENSQLVNKTQKKQNQQKIQNEQQQQILEQNQKDKNNQQKANSDDQIDKIDKQIVKQLVEQQLKIQNQKRQNGKSQQIQNIKQKINQKNQQKQIKSRETVLLKTKSQKSPIQKIKEGIKDLNSETIQSIFDLLIKDKNLVDIFIAAKGIQACLDSLIKAETSSKQALLISLCLQGTGVAQKCVWDWGINKIFQKITQLLQDQTKLKHNIIQVISDLIEILISISLYEPYRLKLSNDQKVFQFIEKTYSKLMFKSRVKSKTQLLSLFIIFMSNLLSGTESGLKNKFFFKDNKFYTLINSLYVMILDQHSSSNRNFLDLKKNVYGLIANLVTNSEHRKAFIEFAFKNFKFQELTVQLQQYPRSMENFVQYTQAILSILVNLTLDTHLSLPTLQDILFDRYVSNAANFNKQIVYRCLLILSRLKYESNNIQKTKKRLKIFETFAKNQNPLKNVQQKSNMIQIVRILNALYTPSQKTKNTLQLSIPIDLFKTLGSYLTDNLVHQNLFCNTANLFGMIVLSDNSIKNDIFQMVASSMNRLVFIAKQKTGNWRKNAAILIAKCSSNQKVKMSMQKQHAMDVLKSIAHLITQKK